MEQKIILIVDDDPGSLKLVEAILSTNGYSVITAKGGEEVEDKINAKQPDLIIMDLLMPNVGGSDAVKILKKNPSGKNIPVIFLTAVMTMDAQSGVSYDIQVDDITYKTLSKPVQSKKLLEEVASLIKAA